eukprot:1973645-Ditylum_brightwellii.AAC.1
MRNQCEDKKPYMEWKCSVKGQNIIVIEVYPNNINCSCPGFQHELSKCGLAHFQLDTFRHGVLVVNICAYTPGHFKLPPTHHWSQAPLTSQTTSAYARRYQLGSTKPTHRPLSLTPP